MMFSLVVLCFQKQKNLSKTRFQNAVPILHASEKVAALAQCVGVFQKRGTRTFRVIELLEEEEEPTGRDRRI